jgi:diaminopimelate epimerase
VETARVNMGAPILNSKEIPVISENDKVIDEEIIVKGKSYRMTCVSMGNPHAVVFVDDINDIRNFDLEAVGTYFENHERFPERTNTEFVRVIDRNNVQMRVWERGTGETLACGTGCCATAVACVLNGRTDEKVNVHVLGGEIMCEWDRDENIVYMTGSATTVFEGEVEV